MILVIVNKFVNTKRKFVDEYSNEEKKMTKVVFILDQIKRKTHSAGSSSDQIFF